MRTIVAGLAITLDGVTESPSSWLHFNDEMGDVIAAGIAQSDVLGAKTQSATEPLDSGWGEDAGLDDQGDFCRQHCHLPHVKPELVARRSRDAASKTQPAPGQGGRLRAGRSFRVALGGTTRIKRPRPLSEAGPQSSQAETPLHIAGVSTD
jgi:hypothetical protein